MKTPEHNDDSTQNSDNAPSENLKEQAKITVGDDVFTITISEQADKDIQDASGNPADSAENMQIYQEILSQITDGIKDRLEIETAPALVYSGKICGTDVENVTLSNIADIINQYAKDNHKYYTVSAVSPVFYEQMLTTLNEIDDGKECIVTSELPAMITSPALVINKFVGGEVRMTLVQSYDFAKNVPADMSQILSLMLNIKMEITASKRGDKKALSIERGNMIKRGFFNFLFMIAVLVCFGVSIAQSVTGVNATSWLFGGLMLILWMFNRGVFNPFFPSMSGRESCTSAQVRSIASSSKTNTTFEPESLARLAIGSSLKRDRFNTIIIIVILFVLIYNLFVPGDFSLAQLFGGEPETHSIWG